MLNYIYKLFCMFLFLVCFSFSVYSSACTYSTPISEYDTEAFNITKISVNDIDIYNIDEITISDDITELDIEFTIVPNFDVDNSYLSFYTTDLEGQSPSVSSETLDLVEDSQYTRDVSLDVNLKTTTQDSFTLVAKSSGGISSCFERSYTINIDRVQKVFDESFNTDKILIRDISINNQDLYYNDNAKIQRDVTEFEVYVKFLSKGNYNDTQFTALLLDFDENIVAKSDELDILLNEEYEVTFDFDVDLTETKKDDFILKIVSSNTLEDEFEKEYEIEILELDKSISIEDFFITPTSLVEKGDTIKIVIELENTGLSNEEGVIIQLRSEDILLQENIIIDEIEIGESIEEEFDFTLPNQITAKDYKIEATIYFDRGRENVKDDIDITILDTQTNRDSSRISYEFDESINAYISENNFFLIDVINQNDEEKVISISSITEWAQVSTNPSVLIVSPNSKKSIKVNVIPKETALTQSQFLTLQIKEGSRIENEINVLVNVLRNTEEENQKTYDLNLFLIGLIVFGILMLLIIMFFKSKDKQIREETKLDEREILNNIREEETQVSPPVKVVEKPKKVEDKKAKDYY